MSTETAHNGRANTPETNGAPTDPIGEAIAHEDAIREEAEQIRGEQPMTRILFSKLQPLLKRPIPAAFIEHVGRVEGKPYESTGVRSVQVQIDRMDNVLGAGCWRDDVEYHEEGKLAEVIVTVFDNDGKMIVQRSSWGGVNRGSTLGNIRKGSYTNAAKPAFARIGPAHEVYLGIADYDPDVNADAAGEQRPEQPRSQREPARPHVPDIPADLPMKPERAAALLQRLGETQAAMVTDEDRAVFTRRLSTAYTAAGGKAQRINAEAIAVLSDAQADEFEKAVWS